MKEKPTQSRFENHDAHNRFSSIFWQCTCSHDALETASGVKKIELYPHLYELVYKLLLQELLCMGSYDSPYSLLQFACLVHNEQSQLELINISSSNSYCLSATE